MAHLRSVTLRFLAVLCLTPVPALAQDYCARVPEAYRAQCEAEVAKKLAGKHPPGAAAAPAAAGAPVPEPMTLLAKIPAWPEHAGDTASCAASQLSKELEGDLQTEAMTQAAPTAPPTGAISPAQTAAIKKMEPYRSDAALAACSPGQSGLLPPEDSQAVQGSLDQALKQANSDHDAKLKACPVIKKNCGEDGCPPDPKCAAGADAAFQSARDKAIDGWLAEHGKAYKTRLDKTRSCLTKMDTYRADARKAVETGMTQYAQATSKTNELILLGQANEHVTSYCRAVAQALHKP